MDQSEINAILHGIAQRFESAELPVTGILNAFAWGQFLDDPQGARQIGPYGTSAGLIVSSLAGRGTAAMEPRLSACLETGGLNGNTRTVMDIGFYAKRFG